MIKRVISLLLCGALLLSLCACGKEVEKGEPDKVRASVRVIRSLEDRTESHVITREFAEQCVERIRSDVTQRALDQISRAGAPVSEEEARLCFESLDIQWESGVDANVVDFHITLRFWGSNVFVPSLYVRLCENIVAHFTIAVEELEEDVQVKVLREPMAA